MTCAQALILHCVHPSIPYPTVYDSVQMGAMAYVSTYFEEAFTQTAIDDVTQKTKNRTIDVFYAERFQRESYTDKQKIDGVEHQYTISAVTRIGEFATSDSAGSGGVTSEGCKIGNTIAPQVRTDQ